MLHIIFPILLCPLIGYCTNYFAIKMFFHPYLIVDEMILDMYDNHACPEICYGIERTEKIE